MVTTSPASKVVKSPAAKKLTKKRTRKEMQEEEDPFQLPESVEEEEPSEQEEVDETAGDKPLEEVGVQQLQDEYEEDSSDEEDLRNTIGNVPLKWYDEFDHIGYDLAGEKILKGSTGDTIDQFLKKCNDPNFGRTVVDSLTGEEVILSEKDIELIKQYRKGRTIATDNLYEPFEDFFTFEKMKHPLRNFPPQKRSFVPSVNDKRKVSKLVYAIKMGWIKPKSDQPDPEKKVVDVSFWDEAPNEDALQHLKRRIDAPQRKLPDHFSSCHPPPEYLFTEEEEGSIFVSTFPLLTNAVSIVQEEEWKNQEPEERMLRFIPQDYTSMRHIPTSRKVELFDWLQDLSLCPRQRKLKIHVDPEALLPKLPQPQELKPFPSRLNKVYKGHTDFVRTISVDCGEWLASGGDDCTLRVWHIRSGHCIRTITFDHKVKHVVWCPKKDLHLLAVVVENDVYIVDPKVDDPDQVEEPVWDVVKSYRSNMEEPTEDSPAPATQWRLATEEEYATKGLLCVVTHPKLVSRVVWHSSAKYFVSITSGTTAVFFHKFYQFHSGKFSKFKSQVQDVALHPTKPLVFLATKIHLLVYNITTQSLVKKMLTNCQWISRIALHPLGESPDLQYEMATSVMRNRRHVQLLLTWSTDSSCIPGSGVLAGHYQPGQLSPGDNVLIGSYENHVAWLDMEFSNKPYKMMRYHKGAIRSIVYHPSRPLFASGSDDGKIVVTHGMVYDDYSKSPLIVAVKVLRGHQAVSKLTVLDCVFHPQEPWLFSAGADGNIHLYTDE
ncbi:BOP1 [Cordylochernes scorpioides]|uniref:BOP1 n=1 Tax=Cordylochernes scorpioides TaxID=51811 RepID=A0ABY6KB84_9ARAC|nr:BOP1 [Cordylochernes scorpioides]